MRGGGLTELEHVTGSNRPQSLWSALVITGLAAASCGVGAVGTLLFLTQGSVYPGAHVAQALDVAREALSSVFTTPDADAPRVSPPTTADERALSRAETTKRRIAAGPRTVTGAPVEGHQGGWVPREPAAFFSPDRFVPTVPRAAQPALALRRDHVTALPELAVGGQVVLPIKTKDIHPAYPNVARRARIGGVVVLEAMITAEGYVSDVRVATSAPLLDDAALAAVRRWH
ncbi:MAG: energy transducer TonB [Acidobacteria bacterium]|nr:energy transducer TonB [Acidobacteriota bacterium]